MADDKNVEQQLQELEANVNTKFYVCMLGIVASIFVTIMVWWMSMRSIRDNSATLKHVVDTFSEKMNKE